MEKKFKYSFYIAISFIFLWLSKGVLAQEANNEMDERSTICEQVDQQMEYVNETYQCDDLTSSVEIVEELQVDTPQVDYEEPKDAETLAQEWIENGPVSLGWNEDKNTFVAIGQASFDSQDPSYDDSFIIKRSLKTMEATLEAKAEIIEFISTEMSAADKVTTPGTDLHAQFHAKIEKLERKQQAMLKKIADMLEDVDKKEADALRGVVLGDRANALMDAAISKLDLTYSPEKVEEKQLQKYEKAKARYEEAVAAGQVLEQEIAAHQGEITGESSSSVETMSKMPLFGAVTVQQFESWDEDSERYKVALVVVWGQKLEKFTRALIKGEDFEGKKSKFTIKQWLKKQNLAVSTGSRRVTDEKGNIYFVGIASSAEGTSSGSAKKARGISAQFAKKEVVMSIYADIESHKKAEAMMQEKSAGRKTASEAAESFASELKATIENRKVSGLSKIKGTSVVHPISGQKIYVSVYAISAKSVRQALKMQESSYITKMMDIKSQQKLKGTEAGLKDAVRATEKDRSAFNKARSSSNSNARSQVVDKKSTELRKPTKPKVRSKSVPEDDGRPESVGNRAGGYSGSSESSADAFDW
jgi:hypothetical protein